MKEFKALIGFIRIDDEFIVDRNHLWWAVLPDAVKLYFDATEIELEHRRHPLDTFLLPFDPVVSRAERASA